MKRKPPKPKPKPKPLPVILYCSKHDEHYTERTDCRVCAEVQLWDK